jgi:hypothetical protein
MKYRRQKWLVALPFLIGLFIPLGIATASAGYYGGSERTIGPADGYSYTNVAYLETTVPDEYAWTETLPLYAGTEIPGNYLGVQASLFESGGALCVQSSVDWDSSPNYGLFTNSPVGDYCGSGQYYGKGWSHIYNGTGYDVYGTYDTAGYSI